MIEVENLVKRYGSTVAVNGLTFRVGAGDIVGLLGPNGAGKTTTLRILAGYLSPTSGRVRVAGYDALKESISVRQRIGYVPERVSLYPEMRVKEYLHYRARLKGLHGRRRRVRVGEVMDMLDVAHVRRRLIGHLSRGYRQRVALADALVAEPDVLILDEPTLGLDPNQARQVRGILESLPSHQALLISTHLLAEIEMVCQRVLILNRGRMVAADAPGDLAEVLGGNARYWMEVAGTDAEDVEAGLREAAGVVTAEVSGYGGIVQVEVECARDTDLGPELYRIAVQRGWLLRELHKQRDTLEDVFVAMTNGTGNR